MKEKVTLRKFCARMQRERRQMLVEISQVKGLAPLLMKARNGRKWSAADRRELRAHLKKLSQISPYIAFIVLPGGFVMLPLLAWWLDRRRGRRALVPRRVA